MRSIFPDTLVGTDSHATMVNGLSVLGWGVGGIKADWNARPANLNVNTWIYWIWS